MSYVNLIISVFADSHSVQWTALQAECRQYKKAAYAESIKACYASMHTAFLRFCLYFGLTPVPASKSTVVLYATFLTRTLSPTSIAGYLNIIRIMHEEYDYNNLLLDWELRMVKRGVQRCHGKPPKQRSSLHLKFY